MSWQDTFNRGMARWIVRPLCILAVVVVLINVGKRWRMLHGTTAPAVVYQQLGKEGSGSSGVYKLVVRYSQPQHHQQFAHVATDRSRAETLLPGTPVRVCYHPDYPTTALLTSEWSYSGNAIAVTLACLVTFFCLPTTRSRRS